ncbi:hypothetical protein ACVILK_005344 [Bradyrhizobium embrapense]
MSHIGRFSNRDHSRELSQNTLQSRVYTGWLLTRIALLALIDLAALAFIRSIP